MAAGAVDNTLDIAFFSARSSELEGGQVDIAGPGVDFSAAEVAAHTEAGAFLQANLPALSDRHRRAAALDQLLPWLVRHQREG